MQWDATANAGFTRGNPWLPIGDDYNTVNVSRESGDPHSMLVLYRSLLKLRRANLALAIGSISLEKTDSDVLAYYRQNDKDRFLVLLNFAGAPQYFKKEQSEGPVGTFDVS